MAKRLKQPKTLTPEQVAALAESVGLPGETFAQIARGESGYQVGAVGHDPGGTQGLGLWQITTKYNDDIIKKFGGRQKLLTDPLANARAAKAIYDRQGIKAWYGTKYMTGSDLHYKGTSQPPVSPATVPAAAPPIQATPATPGVNNAPLRRQAVSHFLQQGGVRNPNATLALAGTYGSLADTPAQAAPADASYAQPQPKGQTPALKTGAVGAQTALSWAKSKVGDPGSKETGGENRGKLADYANSRFGMSGQPWCAMFTSMAVTKGGAPKNARTASVAEVRRQAQAGDGGYQKGFVKKAKPGDLILFGSSHIGMVDHVENGKIWYVGGNQSDNVTLASVAVGGGDIVRPKYGTRKKK